VEKGQKRDLVSSHVVRMLRDERVHQGLSMTVLAQRAGLSQAMISFVEREIRNPSLDTLLRMTEVLDVNLGEIIKRAYIAAARRKQK